MRKKSVRMLLELEAQLPEGVDLFWYNYQSEVMYNMVYNNMSSFVDYENGECYFDTDEFKAVLAYAKEQPAEMVWDESTSLPASLAADEVIFNNFIFYNSHPCFFNSHFSKRDSCLICSHCSC